MYTPVIEEVLEVRNERSATVGEYYRDLSLHYREYSAGYLPWPVPPRGLSPAKGEYYVGF